MDIQKVLRTTSKDFFPLFLAAKKRAAEFKCGYSYFQDDGQDAQKLL